MHYEYRVIPSDELMATPSVWQFPATRAREYAATLQEALSRMADNGWRLVESHKEPWSGSVVFIFEREVRDERASDGIQTARSGTTC